MALRQYTPIGWSKRLTNVRVYLDDIEQAVADLAPTGDTRLVVSHKDGRLSRCDTVDDVIGREDIASLLVTLTTLQEHERVEIEVDRSAIRVDVATNRDDIKVIVENFINSLERIKATKLWIPTLATAASSVDVRVGFFSAQEVISNRVQLILDRRITASQARQQRRHDLLVGLTSGILGAAVGAAATIAGVILS
jgi:hypothetical protein